VLALNRNNLSLFTIIIFFGNEYINFSHLSLMILIEMLKDLNPCVNVPFLYGKLEVKEKSG
jgi:hypothetical protein